MAKTKVVVEIEQSALFKIYHEALRIQMMHKSGPAVVIGIGVILTELEKAVPQLKEATPLR